MVQERRDRNAKVKEEIKRQQKLKVQHKQIHEMMHALDDFSVEASSAYQEKLNDLQKVLAEKRKILAEIEREEAVLEEENRSVITETLPTPLASTTQFERMKLAVRKHSRFSSIEVQQQEQQLESDVSEMKDLLRTLVMESDSLYQTQFTEELIRHMLNTVVDAVANEGRPILMDPDISLASTQTGTSTLSSNLAFFMDPPSTPAAILSSLVLQNLFLNGGELKLTTLKEAMGRCAVERGWSGQMAVQAVYTLVANGLIEIVRRGRESVVKMC